MFTGKTLHVPILCVAIHIRCIPSCSFSVILRDNHQIAVVGTSGFGIVGSTHMASVAVS
jgi:hypothetical protein